LLRGGLAVQAANRAFPLIASIIAEPVESRLGGASRMARPDNNMFRIGDWQVNSSTGELSRNGETVRVETRTMRLLLCLAERPGEVVSIEELLDQAWSGVTVSSDSVYQAVASLRRLLGDDPRQPTYIATVPRLGYRMLAPVSAWRDGAKHQTASSATATPVQTGLAAVSRDEPSIPPGAHAPDSSRALGWRRPSTMIWAIAALCVALVLAFFFYRGVIFKNRPAQASSAAQSQKSLAVLPFLDLTPGMKEEEFADGLTEEIIDKLSKVPGFRVPAATASFYFKYKKIPLADIAKSLGVVYILDGSTRVSGDSVRIAARLVRAEHGYVIWSETYDRPFVNRVAIQDEIAGEVIKALRAAVEGAVTNGQPSPLQR
jgi:transcriptional activator of cad operon